MSEQAQGPGWWQASDGKWYPPQAPPPPQAAAVPEPKKGRGRGCLTAIGALVVLAVIIVIVVVAAGGKSDDKTTNTTVASHSPQATAAPGVTQSNTGGKYPPSADATVTACAVDDIGFLHGTVHIVNNSPKASDYDVSVKFESADGKTLFDTDDAYVNNLAPGQQTDQDAESLKSDPPPGAVCTISEVDRHEHVAD